MLYQATAGAIGRNFEGGPPPSNSEAVVNALGDAAVPGGMAALEGGLKYAAGPLKDAGLKLIKSAWKINKPAAKMSDASMGGSRVNQATDKMITDVAEEGLGAPSKRNENTLLDRLTQAGKKVETDWVEPAERPIGITRADRLLPSQASGTETTTLHTPDAAPFEGAVPAASIPNPLGAQYPFNLAPESAAAGSHPPQHLGEGARVTATGGNDSPGVLLRETGPRVEGGQPFDTVAKADILAGLDADIAAAKHAMAPTTGLEALRARWEQAPDFIPRDQAREIVKSINMRNAPRYHNALNDPVAVAAEKGVGRTITGQMKTDEMAKANARYQLLKPMSVAMSDAARRAGNRDVIGLKGAMTANAMATAGATRYGLPGFIGGGALGLGMSAMTHPVAKGTVGQGMYDIGKALPGINSKLITPEMTRQLILQLLLQGK
jgi:hypothetical protein